MQSGPRPPAPRAGYPPPAGGSPPPMFPERRHGSLRVFASSCIISAWLSLILSVLFGIGLLAAPAPTLPTGLPGYSQPSPYGPGMGGDGLGGGPAAAIGALLPLASGLRVIGGLLTIAGGVLTFFCLAAVGQSIYVLLDMEENTRITAQALATIARRMGT